MRSAGRSLGIPRRRSNRSIIETQAKKNATEGTYKRKSRSTPHTPGPAQHSTVSVATAHASTTPSVVATVHASTIPPQLSDPIETMLASTTTQRDSQESLSADGAAIIPAQHSVPVEPVQVAIPAQHSVPAEPVQIAIANPQDRANSEGEDIFKCPLLNWSLCEAYAKKKVLRGNAELVEAITKVLGVPINHRSFSMSRQVVMQCVHSLSMICFVNI